MCPSCEWGELCACVCVRVVGGCVVCLVCGWVWLEVCMCTCMCVDAHGGFGAGVRMECALWECVRVRMECVRCVVCVKGFVSVCGRVRVVQ